jgi:hypothetical protein
MVAPGIASNASTLACSLGLATVVHVRAVDRAVALVCAAVVQGKIRGYGMATWECFRQPPNSPTVGFLFWQRVPRLLLLLRALAAFTLATRLCMLAV